MAPDVREEVCADNACALSVLQSVGKLDIDSQGLIWRKAGGGRKVELARKGAPRSTHLLQPHMPHSRR